MDTYYLESNGVDAWNSELYKDYKIKFMVLLWFLSTLPIAMHFSISDFVLPPDHSISLKPISYKDSQKVKNIKHLKK